MISFFSAKKSFLDVKIIIFIGQRADVQEYPNPPNITNYMSQNIIVFTLTAEVEMEILKNPHPVLHPEAFIGSIY